MPALALAFLFGDWLQLQQAALWRPSAYAWVCIAGLACLTLAMRFTPFAPRVGAMAAVACVAFAVTGWRAQARMGDRLVPAQWGRVVFVDGVVTDLPRREGRHVSFDFAPDAGTVPKLPSLVRVGWSSPPSPPRAGERWALALRLRPVHGLSNPGGFDAELRALSAGVGARANVVPREMSSRKLSGEVPGTWLVRLRERWRARIDRALRGSGGAGAIAALALGDQGAVEASEWAVWRDTGVAHLMAISGLHVSMLAAAAGWAAGAAWRRSARLSLWIAAPDVAAWARMGAGLSYALVAGFGLPAQRAVLMLIVAAMLRLRARRPGWRETMAWALVAVLALDPWAPLQAGFWLSFCAVALLCISDEGRASQGWRARLGAAARAQCVVNAGMAPLGLLFFGQAPLVAPLANAFAIPMVTLGVVPLAVAGLVLPAPLDAWAWHVGAWVHGWVLWGLTRLAGCAQWHAAQPSAVLLVLSAAGACLLALPWPWRLRIGGAVLIAPLVLNPGRPPAQGHLEAWMADVGQGSAIVLRTARHVLVFDAGPAPGPGSDTGARVLVPLLRALGVRRIDRVVISHADADHIGGAGALAHAFPGTPALGSVPPARLRALGFSSAQPCHAGQTWTWDGVYFAMLHPPSAVGARSRNAVSCVLHVRAQGASMLLTGDIERPEEEALAAAAPLALRAALLLAPHHGSATSSSRPFIDAVGPRVVAVQAGLFNRYGHPHPAVLARYADAGVAVGRTDLDGALRWRDTQPYRLDAWRRMDARYWRETACHATAKVLE